MSRLLKLQHDHVSHGTLRTCTKPGSESEGRYGKRRRRREGGGHVHWPPGCSRTSNSCPRDSTKGGKRAACYGCSTSRGRRTRSPCHPRLGTLVIRPTNVSLLCPARHVGRRKKSRTYAPGMPSKGNILASPRARQHYTYWTRSSSTPDSRCRCSSPG
jgi:hypothetical protein